ncbi:MAG: hypothetical protein IJ867_07000 [Clostridia bacterium]|nr:hypothetical protein [Clostridia bacterium]
MDENTRLENSVMDEIIAKLETLFEENPEYNMEKLKGYLNRTGELTIMVNRIKEEIMNENPNISHEEMIELASQRVADLVREGEHEVEQNENDARD